MSDLTTMVFGIGDKEIDTGIVGGKPCVFVTQLSIIGPVGELIPDDMKKHVPKDPHFAMIFPTAEQAQRVADAICNPDAGLPSLNEKVKKDATRWNDFQCLWFAADELTVQVTESGHFHIGFAGAESGSGEWQGTDPNDVMDKVAATLKDDPERQLLANEQASGETVGEKL
jgi:hypothetical protein